VRAAPKREMKADWWVSPWGGGTVTATVGNMPVTVVILASEANGLSQGWTGKAATCLSAGAKKQSREESGMAGDAFECARARSNEGKRRWVGSVPSGAREERKGRGRGAAPCEPARHRRGGSGPLGQRRAAHIT
jgi:hypothetical protein